ncbi:PLDc N-terminal domain-containing protein [Agromyces mediolanus]|uniref:PLDc N-terminal domain-containing protein n=1 Tax=Agromyces mediolanus TaxID=41986 RepID=UPI001E65DBAC|nr:PLDc N-terminal domain-containing protein [Agromyces mediolanus]MCD1570744.1 PLDc N-terminal domain-containing protein [Agromyces mediolanus]
MNTDPVIPLWFSAYSTLVAVLAVALLVAAFVSVLRSPGLSAAARVVWIVAIWLVPVLGPLAWFAWRWLHRRTEPSNDPPSAPPP